MRFDRYYLDSCENFRRKGTEHFSFVSDIQCAGTGVYDILGEISKMDIPNFFSSIGSSIGSIFTEPANLVGDVTVGLFNNIKDVAAATVQMPAQIGLGIGNVIGNTATGIGKIGSEIGGIFSSIGGLLAQVGKLKLDLTPDDTKSAKLLVKQLIGDVAKGISGVDWTQTTLSVFLTNYKTQISQKVQSSNTWMPISEITKDSIGYLSSVFGSTTIGNKTVAQFFSENFHFRYKKVELNNFSEFADLYVENKGEVPVYHFVYKNLPLQVSFSKNKFGDVFGMNFNGTTYYMEPKNDNGLYVEYFQTKYNGGEDFKSIIYHIPGMTEPLVLSNYKFPQGQDVTNLPYKITISEDKVTREKFSFISVIGEGIADKVVGPVLDVVGTVGTTVSSWLNTALGPFKTIAAEACNGIKSAVSSIKQISGQPGGLGKYVADQFSSQVTSKITNPIRSFKNDATGFITSIGSTVTNAINSATTATQNAFTSAANKSLSDLTSAASKIKEIQNAIDSINLQDYFNMIVQYAMKYIPTPQQILDELKNSLVNPIVNKANSVWGSIVDGFNDALGLNDSDLDSKKDQLNIFIKSSENLTQKFNSLKTSFSSMLSTSDINSINQAISALTANKNSLQNILSSISASTNIDEIKKIALKDLDYFQSIYVNIEIKTRQNDPAVIQRNTLMSNISQKILALTSAKQATFGGDYKLPSYDINRINIVIDLVNKITNQTSLSYLTTLSTRVDNLNTEVQTKIARSLADARTFWQNQISTLATYLKNNLTNTTLTTVDANKQYVDQIKQILGTIDTTNLLGSRVAENLKSTATFSEITSFYTSIKNLYNQVYNILNPNNPISEPFRFLNRQTNLITTKRKISTFSLWGSIIALILALILFFVKYRM